MLTRRALIGATLAAAAGGCAQALPGALVILAGQSNALGFGLGPKDLPTGQEPDKDVLIWNGKAFETMRPGDNTGTPLNPQAWGPEVAFARAWRADHPAGRLFIVKSVKGSTALARNPELDWSPQSGELFALTGDRIHAAQAGLKLPVSAILWMQGEEDATRPDWAQAYEANLSAALSAMRAGWAQTDTPLILGRIGRGFPYAEQVRQAQARVQAHTPRSALVDTDAYPLQDGVHYAAAGQMALGADMHRAFRSLVPGG